MLITAAQVRAHLPGLTGTAEDAALEVLIARAEEWAALWCGYAPATDGGTATMEDVERTSYLDGAVYDAPDTLRLPIWPVVSVTSIHDSPARLWDATTLVSSSAYEVEDGPSGRVRLFSTASHAWGTGRRSIRVVYTAGYASAPPALASALVMLTRHLYDRRALQGLTSTRGADQAPLAPETMPEIVQQQLAPFRLPSVWL